jgi:diguanylate cyclase (GGDEF)-like protein
MGENLTGGTSLAAAPTRSAAAVPFQAVHEVAGVLDEITLFFQRRHFDEQLALRLRQAETERRRLAVILVDADGLARINERWGMATGDAIMVGFDRRIAASVAPDDVFAHHDGRRLAIVRWAPSADRALAFAQHLASRVSGAPFEFPGGRDAAFLTASVGVALGGAARETTIIVAAAAEALRRAKRGGGNRVCLADSMYSE